MSDERTIDERLPEIIATKGCIHPEEVIGLCQSLIDARKIIADLAESYPISTDFYSRDYCVYCGYGRLGLPGDFNHQDDCVWLRANQL